MYLFSFEKYIQWGDSDLCGSDLMFPVSIYGSVAYFKYLLRLLVYLLPPVHLTLSIALEAVKSLRRMKAAMQSKKFMFLESPVMHIRPRTHYWMALFEERFFTFFSHFSWPSIILELL
jgi:hypothetical protein